MFDQARYKMKIQSIIKKVESPEIGTTIHIQFKSETKREVLVCRYMGQFYGGYVVQALDQDGDNVMLIMKHAIKRVIFPGLKEMLDE